MLTTLIHVGDSDDQKVVYADQEMIYYFLAQFADPEIVPWVHTVMFGNLQREMQGAYHQRGIRRASGTFAVANPRWPTHSVLP